MSEVKDHTGNKLDEGGIGSYIPKHSKKGYWTKPPYVQIREMSKSKLRSLQNFCIGNSYGSIYYECGVDITYCDLDEIFIIGRDKVEVYPEVKFPAESKPPIGEKLNQPALISFFNSPYLRKINKVCGSDNQRENLALNTFLEIARSQTFELREVDLNKSFWQIRVPHFTKYGLFSSGDEEADEHENEHEKENHNSNKPYPGQTYSDRDLESATDVLETDSSSHQKKGRVLREITATNTPMESQDDLKSIDFSQKRANIPLKFGQKNKMSIIPEENEQMDVLYMKKRLLNDERTETAYIERRSESFSRELNSNKANAQTYHERRLSQSSEKVKKPFEESESSIRPQFDFQNSEDVQSNSMNIFWRAKPFDQSSSQGSVIIKDSNELLYNSQREKFTLYSEEFKKNSFYYEEGPVSAQDESDYIESINRRRARLNSGNLRANQIIFNKLNKIYENLYKFTSCDSNKNLNRTAAPIIGNNLDERGRKFCLNRSFRVGWSRDGFITLRGERMLSLHNINTFKSSFKKVEPLFPPEEALHGHSKYVFSSEINLVFFKSLFFNATSQETKINASKFSEIEDKMEKMHIERDTGNKLSSDFSKMFVNIDNFNNHLVSYFINAFNLIEKDEKYRKYNNMLQDEYLFWALVNSLFGNPFFDLNGIISKMKVYPHKRQEVIHDRVTPVARLDERVIDRKRKNLTCEWIKARAEKFVNEDFKKIHSTVGGASEKSLILNFLSGGCVNKASYEADMKGAQEMAVLISSIKDNYNKKFCEEERRFINARYRAPENYKFYSVIQVLSGDTSFFQNFDWLRKFGCKLWYSIEDKTPLAQAIYAFFQDPANFTSKDHEVLPYAQVLLSHYCKMKMNASELKYPSGSIDSQLKNIYCFDKNDQKHKWILFQYLKANGKLGNDFRTNTRDYELRLLSKFCFQLETMRLWDIAILIVRLTDEEILPVKRKDAIIRALVHRNYRKIHGEALGKRKRKEIRRICETELNINPLFFEEAIAYSYLSQNLEFKAMKHMHRCNNPIALHNLILSKCAPTILVVNSYEADPDPSLIKLHAITSKLRECKITIPNWKTGGKYISKFINEFILGIEKDHKKHKNLVPTIIRAIRFFEAKKEIGFYFKALLVKGLIKKALHMIGETVECEQPFRLNRENIKKQIELIVGLQKELDSYGLNNFCDFNLQNKLKTLGIRYLSLSYVTY